MFLFSVFTKTFPSQNSLNLIDNDSFESAIFAFTALLLLLKFINIQKSQIKYYLQKKLITIFKSAITLKTTLHLSTPNLKHNQPSKKIFKKTDKLHDSNNPIPTCKKALVKNACTKIIVQTVEIA